jgi:exopolysaccharide biosynthesis polyprenyl glycosylphosphotransferase
MEIVGCVDDGTAIHSGPESAPRLGRLNDLTGVVRAYNVDHVVVAFSPAAGSTLANLLRSLADDVRISVVPRLFDLLTVRSHVDDLHGMPVVDVAPPSLGPADRFAKRAIDIAVALTGLVLTLPLTIVIAIAIKATSPGPVLFRQERAGRDGGLFCINKFRTMYVGAEADRAGLRSVNEVDGPLFKLRRDPRITPVGAFLRSTSLDEIPQLLNVLLGTMSLVGPRPFVPAESAEIEGWAVRRFEVRPGITGLWQISGRSDLPFEELCRLDYSYVASWSLLWDLRILWHTPAAVVQRRGAY